MLNPSQLWAKSQRDDEPVYPSMRLAGHLDDVLAATDRVLDATADAQLSALNLDPALYRDRLRRCARLAAALHDLGKANSHFQAMIQGNRNVFERPQGLRHEWVSVLLLDGLNDWLRSAFDDVDLALVAWAIAGHHPSCKHENPPRSNPPGAGPEIQILAAHEDVRGILLALAERFELPLPPPVLRTTAKRLSGTQSVFQEIGVWSKSAQKRWVGSLQNIPHARFLAALKANLIAADVAGSALPKADPSVPPQWDWITTALGNLPQPGDFQKVAAHRLKNDPPRPFQEAVAASKAPVTYVKAGCGTGKTLAAYLWAAANHPTRRLYFCYPTTGTATEGFKDYLHDPDGESGELGKLGARLFHSRRDVDFDIILESGDDSTSPETDTAQRQDALEAWSTPIVSCTVDTVLGIVQNTRKGLFAWPALAQSAFVFDEIHAYDDRLFGALLRFLRDLPGLPCLLMTASLPKAREQALARTIQSTHGLELAPIAGPADLETLPRYHRQELPPNADPLPLIQAELAAGGKVLWVCNTVARAMQAADAAETAGLKPLVYHSRFRYEDRVERHKAVVDAFTSENPQPALAVCTQVAEMSLDLKGCTLLVTDLAPVPALIQRLGRLNRQAEPNDPTRPFVVIEPDSSLPYTPADFDAAREWLARLPTNPISQQHLAKYWEQSADHPPNLIPSAWLDGGPTTRVTELREASPGITVLMETDCHRVRQSPRNLARHVLPMPPPPRSLHWHGWPRFRGIPVAPSESISYNPERGAQWVKPE